MNEQEFMDRLEQEGFTEGTARIDIHFRIDEENNKCFVDFDSIGEQIKKMEQELLIIQNEQEFEK